MHINCNSQFSMRSFFFLLDWKPVHKKKLNSRRTMARRNCNHIVPTGSGGGDMSSHVFFLAPGQLKHANAFAL
jgi:hypothetical protein